MARRLVPYTTWASVLLVLLIPCYWQSRIVSADLGSHIYNAWLATQVAAGQAVGVYAVPQWNNVLFDWMLLSLLPIIGSGGAQRVAVSFAVLIFAGGSLALIRTTSRRMPWHVLPAIAMLAYGFVFHVGLFNFYIASGFSCGALALLWHFTPRRIIFAAPLIALSVVAHPLPAVWLGAVMGFAGIARRIRIGDRHLITLGGFVAIVVTAKVLPLMVTCNWQPVQLYLWSGADQAIVYGDEYLRWGLGWLAWWALLFGLLLVQMGWPRVLKSVLFHLIVLQAAVLLFIPSRIQLPGYSAHFSLFTERMSLLQGVLVCALLARVPLSAAAVAPGVLLAAGYFYRLHADDGLITRFEDKVIAATGRFSGLPRAVSGLCTPARRFNYGFHLLDRACVGKCLSYANYEPASGQFRLRARQGNGSVVSEIDRAYAFEAGGAIVTPQDLPLLRVEGVIGGEVTVRELAAGEKVSAPCPESQ